MHLFSALITTRSAFGISFCKYCHKQLPNSSSFWVTIIFPRPSTKKFTQNNNRRRMMKTVWNNVKRQQKTLPQHFLQMHQNDPHTVGFCQKRINYDQFTTLHIYDFDGTLFNTPEPASGQMEYFSKTGRTFPRGYWWNMRESLDLNVFDIAAGPAYQDFWKSVQCSNSSSSSSSSSGNQHQSESVEEQQEQQQDLQPQSQQQENTCTLMMTGRSYSLRSSVLRIMNKHRMRPMLSIFRPLKYSNSTLSYKQAALKELINLFPNVTQISMWDDRIEHVEEFRRMKLKNSKLNTMVKMTIHHVSAVPLINKKSAAVTNSKVTKTTKTVTTATAATTHYHRKSQTKQTQIRVQNDNLIVVKRARGLCDLELVDDEREPEPARKRRRGVKHY